MVDKMLYNQTISEGNSDVEFSVNDQIVNCKPSLDIDEITFPKYGPAVKTDNEDISAMSEQSENGYTNGEIVLSTNCAAVSQQTDFEIIAKDDLKDEKSIYGVCGLDNLGNTCFINAAVQCLMATPTIQTLLSSKSFLDKLDTTNELSTVEQLNMVEFLKQLQRIYSKVSVGEYLSLYPKDFHNSIKEVNSCFADFKQHDSQEFLSFVLNILHDYLNYTSDNQQSIQSSSIEVREGCKKLRIDQSNDEPAKSNSADQAWRLYTEKNRSVIVEDIQGQFKSSITCKICSHISTSYEPFMMLSLPIPYAMEKQFAITWLPSPQHSFVPGMNKPIRYVVTVNKNGSVKDIKEKLFQLLKKADEQLNLSNVILTETTSSAHVLALDDRTLVSYIGKQKVLYAHEVIKLSTSHTNDNSLHVEEEKSEASAFSESTGSAWHSCSICFDEIFDEELKVHSVCGGLLCDTCLTSTAKYGSDDGKFSCPTCSRYISIDDYVCFASPKKDEEKPIRQILVPVMFRKPAPENELKKFNLFAHPYICQLPSETSTTEVSSNVSIVFNQWSNTASQIFNCDILLTDGSGLSCALCDRLESCHGCLLKENEGVSLKPGVCITVHFNDISPSMIHLMCSATADVSCSSFRTSDKVTLNECIDKFAEIEHLSESDLWYCEKCKCDQPSIKSMTVTRWPNILIIHLKRFYYEGSRCCKIDAPVEFPQHQLDVNVLCGSESRTHSTPKYDFYASIGHVGSLYGGHYTAIAKKESDLYLFNDESYEKTSISEEDYTKAYVLFYHIISGPT